MYPETKGISFEKMDELYAQKVKPRHFSKAAKEQGMEHIRAPGAQVVAEKGLIATQSHCVEDVAAGSG